MRDGNMSHGRPLAWLRVILLGGLWLSLATNAWAQDAAATRTSGQFGPINPEHTLWRIASENLPDQTVTIPQYMLALVESNPHAFIASNANLMRSGVMLDLPSAELALAVPPDEARQQLQQQNEWLASLSSEEVRAIRLGERPADPLPPREPDPEPEPETEPEHDPITEALVTVDPTAPAEPADESELTIAELDTTDQPGDPAMEAIWQNIEDRQAEVEAEDEPVPVSTPRTDPEPLTLPAASPAVDPGRADPAVVDARQGFPTVWLTGVVGLAGLIGLLVLVVLAFLFWRRRSSAKETPVEAHQSADAAPPEPAEVTAADRGGLAATTFDTPSEQDVGLHPGDPDPEPEDHPSEQPPAATRAAAAASMDTPESPPRSEAPAFDQEDDDAWAGLEASVLNKPEPAESGVDADAGQSGGKDQAISMEDSSFDFGEPEREPVDELLLSSDLDHELEPDQGSSADSLDLDFSFSSQVDGGTPDAGKTEPGLTAEPDAETKPGRHEAMSDADAEISLDLARAMANGSDSDYARELLDEIIAKASDHMAARAREVRDSLNR